MASRYEAEVKLVSANRLKNVNWRHGPNKPYVVVWVDPENKFSTSVDENGDIEANWNQTLVIPLPSEHLEDLTVHIDVVHSGSEEGTKPLMGSARLKLDEVLDDVGIGGRARRTLTLKRPSGRPQGNVDVKVAIRESGYGMPYPPPSFVTPPALRDYSAVPPPYSDLCSVPSQGSDSSSQGSGSYHSAQSPSGYPYSPPPSGQGYRQQTTSYGQRSYENASPEEKKKSKFGGMGTGLAVGAVAGALGGIALVEGAEYLEDKIADDVAEKVDEDDLGYDGDY